MTAASSLRTFSSAARLTTAFYSWEERGRGWAVYPHPVALEPPFRPFELPGHADARGLDDARKPTFLGRWFERLRPAPVPSPEAAGCDIEEPEPPPSDRHDVVEIQVALPPEAKVSPEFAEHFLLSLSTCGNPLSFEVVGTEDAIALQIACASEDAAQVQEQLRSHFPDGVLLEARGTLVEQWARAQGDCPAVVDFGLSSEFMRPLRTFTRFDADPLIAVTGALADLASHEIGILQVLFQPARAPWAGQILQAVRDWEGGDFFIDAPELVPLAERKVKRPLYAAVIRLAARSPVQGRALQIVRRIGGAFAQVAEPASNELIPLADEQYPPGQHVQSVLERRSHRTGVILNSEELVALVHLPSASVRTTRLARGHRRTKAAPIGVVGHELTLGENSHAGTSRSVSLTSEQRLRHTHVVGASGTGKSTLLLNMLVQDMERGQGLALIDPHGDLVGEVLARVPAARMGEVILIDPADTESPVGFNILSAHSELEKTLLASDLVAVFRRLSTSWGDQMTSVLSNGILAFLESSRGGTLADLRRFLVEAEFRKEFLTTVRDREVVYYWQKEFPLLSGKPQAPLLTRLDAFLRPRLVRGMVTQPSSLDFAAIMNEGKILLVKLAQGAIGEENAALLGSLFVAKIHQLALGRQSLAEENRRPFFVYLDEFQHFVTPSMATLLTGARKYRLGLVLAHQELRQLWNQDRDVAGAVLSNTATRVCFRVGDDDAKKLEDGFASFSARDIQNLGVGQAICRVDRADWDFSLTTLPMPLPGADEDEHRAHIVQASRERYGAKPGSIESLSTFPVELAGAVLPRLQPRPDRTAAVKPPAVAKEIIPTEVPVVLPGRGGAQHKYLQELIRRWGESNGWRVTVEKQILDGLGSVDVALERDDVSVACEVGMTSSIGHEIQNIQKCLSAGFSFAVSVVPNPSKLAKMRTQIMSVLPEEAPQIRVVSTEELFEFLTGLAESPKSAGEMVNGYLVSVAKKAASNQRDGSFKRGAVAKVIVNALGRMRK